ncbi:MAG: CRISPR-associated protein [Bacteroidaceae bacterium]|nr:CRISPR-associated protein [Bacteroidaceae bacterium]
MFINLTNHPSHQWAPEQLTAATVYGAVVDIPFPSIAPNADEQVIQSLVNEYETRVLNMAGESLPTVHLMGEMNFTHALVKRLQSRGIVCVASTTERRTEELPDGVKQNKFQFVRFRRYE